MKYSLYDVTELPGPFPSGKLSTKSAFEEYKEVQTLIINLLPVHPYDFNGFYVKKAFSLLSGNEASATVLPGNLSKERIFIVLPKKKYLSFSTEYPDSLKKSCIETDPFYPVTQKNLKKLCGIKSDPVTVINWFDFYCAIMDCVKIPVTGIPVSLSFPAVHKYLSTEVPPGVSVDDICQVIGQNESHMESSSLLCIDHPFTGSILSETHVIETVQPQTLIFIPKNSVEKVPWTERLALMVAESKHFRFFPRYYSHPKQLGTPCQKCLHCMKICPENLVPFMLSALFAAEQIKEAGKFEPAACIECGCCTYVCPSGIPLLHNIKLLKKNIGADQ